MMSLPIRKLGGQHEWLGHWWEPSTFDVRVPGVLRYTAGAGCKLTLIGGFDLDIWTDVATGGKAFSGSRDPDVIHGDVNGIPMTLLGCRCVHSVQKLAFSSFVQKQVIEASTCLEGVYIHEIAAAFAAGYSVKVDGAELTFPSRRMFTSYTLPSENRPRGEYHADVMPTLDDIEWAAVTPTADTIVLRRQWQQLSDGPADIHFSESAEFWCEFSQSRSLENVISHAQDLKLLVALLADQTPAIQWLRCTMSDGTSVNLLPHLAEPPDSHMDGDFARYPLVRDSDSFAQVILAWFELLNKTSAACRILLNMRYNQNSYVEHRLATVMTAAEQLHRGLFDSTPMTPDEFRQVKRILKNAISDKPIDVRKWLNEVLQNRLTLGQRLDGLCDHLPPEVLAIVLPDRKLWLKAVHTRNSLTHTGESGDVGLTYATVVVTEAILLAVLLTQLTIDGNDIVQSQIFSRRLRAARMQAEQYFSSKSTASDPNSEEGDHDD